MIFSVIIPTLNEEKYIGGVLEDLVTQTLKDFEVIVVDGESGDKTVEVVNGYKTKLDLKLVISRGRGISFQRNRGVKMATGKRLVFLDADVRIDPKFIEKLALKVSEVDYATSLLVPDRDSMMYRLAFGLFNLYLRLASSPAGE